jgi:uncharacterized protein (TIGR02678 family)
LIAIMIEELVDVETGEIITKTNGTSTRKPFKSRARNNAQTEALTQAHIALMEHELISRTAQPHLFRLISNQFSALQNWHDQHTGWRIRRSPAVVRLLRPPSALIPGYQFGNLREPKDFACFVWVLWFAESRQSMGHSNEQQFLMSQLAERLEEHSQTVPLAPHAPPLDFKRHPDRLSLARALRALQDLGALQLVDGGSEEWLNQTGQSDALWEFTEVSRSLIIALENDKVQAVAAMLDGDPHTIKPNLLPHAIIIEPLQRAWRTLLLGPHLFQYDDPSAFAALRQNVDFVRSQLGETFGWQLDLRREYAGVIRASGTGLAPVTVLNLQGAADQAALLICAVIRQKVSSNDFPTPSLYGCLLIAKGELDEIFRQVREKHERNWGNTAQKTSSFELMRDVYAKMRLAGLMRGPDRNGNVLIMPTVARYAASYSREDEEEKPVPPEAAVQTALPDMPIAPAKPKPAAPVKPAQTAVPVAATNTKQTNGAKDSYTTVEFAQLSGLTQNAVFKSIRRGALKAEKRGLNWFIPAAELERVKKEREARG